MKGLLGTKYVGGKGFCVETRGVPSDFKFSQKLTERFNAVGIHVEINSGELQFCSLESKWNEDEAVFQRDAISQMLVRLYWEGVC